MCMIILTRKLPFCIMILPGTCTCGMYYLLGIFICGCSVVTWKLAYVYDTTYREDAFLYYDHTGNLHLWKILPSRNFYLWMFCSYLPGTCSNWYLAFWKLAYVFDTTYREDAFLYYDPTGNLHLWKILPSRNFYLWMYCSYLQGTCSNGSLAFWKLAYVYDTTYREDAFLCHDPTGNLHLWKILPTRNFYLWMYSYLSGTCPSGYLASRKLAYVYDTTYREDAFLCYDPTGNWHL
jgi:hypothetical protein